MSLRKKLNDYVRAVPVVGDFLTTEINGRTLTAAALGLSLALSSGYAIAKEKPKSGTATVTIDPSQVRRPDTGRKKTIKRTACGHRRDLRGPGYRCLTPREAGKNELNPADGLHWNDYKADSFNRIKLAGNKLLVYTACPSAALCYDMSKKVQKPQVINRLRIIERLGLIKDPDTCKKQNFYWWHGVCHDKPKPQPAPQPAPQPQQRCCPTNLGACGTPASCDNAGGRYNPRNNTCVAKPAPQPTAQPASQPTQKPAKPEETERFRIYLFGGSLFDTAGGVNAQYGAGFEHTPHQLFSYGAEVGAGNNSNAYSTTTSTSETKRNPLPDGTAYTVISEDLTTRVQDSRNYFLARAKVALNLVGKYFRAFATGGLRAGQETTTDNMERTTSLERDGQTLGIPKTRPGQQSSSEAFVGGEVGGGLESCLSFKLGSVTGDACLDAKALYDSRTGTGNYGPTFSLGGRFK